MHDEECDVCLHLLNNLLNVMKVCWMFTTLNVLISCVNWNYSCCADPVRTVASMATVASVMKSTEPETLQHAMLFSKLTREKEWVMVAEWVTKAVQGPKSIESSHHGGNSVQISDSNVDNTMTLCCLRHPSGHLLDYT